MPLSVTLNDWIAFKPEHYLDYEYEPAVQFLGWVFELSPLAVTFIIGAHQIYKRHGANQSISFINTGPMLKPKETWGPRQDRDKVANDQEASISSMDDGQKLKKRP